MSDYSNNWRSCSARTPRDSDPRREIPTDVLSSATGTGCSAHITAVPQGADASIGVLCLLVERNAPGRGQITIPQQIRTLNSHS